MKNSIKLTLLIVLGVFFTSNAQVIIGGGVSVNIDLPLPNIIIGKRAPAPRRAPAPPTPRAPRPVIHTCNSCNHYHSLGTITNQNRPDGAQTYHVVNTSIQAGRPYNERLLFELDNGESIVLIIHTSVPNDYNYHYHGSHHSNTIQAVLLNGQEIPMHSAALSLQPNQAVINLHSIYDGDFNGTVNL